LRRSNSPVFDNQVMMPARYEPERLVGNFFIEPQAAVMSFAGKREGFTHQEGDHVHDILDSLSHYLMSSTLWWQDGKGDPTKLEKLNQCTGSEQRLKNFTQSPDRWKQVEFGCSHFQISNGTIRPAAK
jgi:hypothetical protein